MKPRRKPATSASTTATSGKSGCWWVGSTQNVLSACTACGLIVSHTSSPPGRRRSRASREEAHERVGGQVLDHVDRGDRAEAAGRERLEVRDRVADRDVEPGRAGARRHARVGVDAARLDPGAP